MNISTRSRTRNVLVRDQVRPERSTCRFVFTPGEGLGADWILTWTVTGPWRTVAARSAAETQTQTAWFDPPEELFDWESAVAPPVFRGDLLSVETNWLARMPEVTSYKVLFDGEPYRHNQIIETDLLSPGVHVFHFIVRLKGRRERMYQVSFSLLNRLSIEFAPDPRPLVLNDKLFQGGGRERRSIINGGSYPFLVRNNTDDDLSVIVQVSDAPVGWQADIGGPPLFRLRGRGTRKLRLQIELLNDGGMGSKPYVSATVGAATDARFFRRGYWMLRNMNFASLIIPVKLSARLRTRIVRKNRLLRGKRQPATYGRWI